tara:strand:+ start:947 stop:1744 length:798 start_codon:yes stop_codon:yes gene_type:complete
VTTPNHESTAEAILAETGPLGYDGEDAAPEAVEAAPAVEAPEDTTDAPAEAEDAPAKRPSWSEALESVKVLDPGAADLMKGMHADYTRKTQELSALRKELQAERKALLSVRQELPEEMPQYDPWDEKSVMARVERAAQARINEMTEAVQREYEARQAEQAYQGFVEEHPEFQTDEGLRGEVQALLEGNESLDLETAYWAAKGRRGREEAAAMAERRKVQRAAKRQAAQAVGVPRRGTTAPKASRQDLKSMSAADLYRMAKQMHGQ